MGQRSDYNTLVSMALGHRLTKEQAKLVDHYRTHEGVPWKEGNAGRSFNTHSSVTDAVATFIEQHSTSMEAGLFSFPAESGL